jgi:small-conductance mechanosensitive channel
MMYARGVAYALSMDAKTYEASVLVVSAQFAEHPFDVGDVLRINGILW